MPIGMIDAQRMTLDMVRDMIELARAHQESQPADGRAIAAAPPPAPAPQERSAESAAERVQLPNDTSTILAADADSDTGGSLTGLLDLSATSGHGGATALLAANDASAAAGDAAAALQLDSEAAPTATDEELMAIDLMLANPLNVSLIAAFAPAVPVLEGGNCQMLIERYGVERVQAMHQLGLATHVVRDSYAGAVGRAIRHPSEDQAWWHSSIEEQASDPGERYRGEQAPERQWEFDLAEFTRWYCDQPGQENQAFAALYGKDVERVATWSRVNSNNDRAVTGEAYAIGDGQFQLSIHHNGFQGEPRHTWSHGAHYGFDSMVAFDPRDPPRMHDAQAVLFDPTLGFVTPSENVDRSSGTDMAFIIIAGAVVSVMTAGAASAAAASVASSTGSAALGAAASGAVTGFAVSLTTGLITGDLSFKSLFIGTLTSALTAGITKGAGFDTAGLDTAGNVVDYGARALAITGKATLQGALTELAGGRFLDGFTAGIASGLGTEIARGLNLQISTALKQGHITDVQASTLRTLAQATGSAISALSDPDNAGYAMARDFLNAMLSSPTGATPTDSGSVGNTAGEDDTVELDFSGVLDGLAGEGSVAEVGVEQADGSTATEQGGTAGGGLTERELEGIEQSDEILARRGDELAEANGLNPVRLPDGRLQYPDGRILTPSGEVVTPSGPDSGSTSAYSTQYRHVSAAQGVPPVGGYENLTPAPDLPLLPPEATPTLPDGRHGSSVAYRDQAGQVFYATYDADGKPVRWLSAAPAAMLVSPAAARAAGTVLTAEMASGNPVLMAAAGATLVGTSWLILRGGDDPFSSSQALPPEQVRNDRQPTILVPVSPGPGGTPGQVADSRDTSMPGYQNPDIVSTGREEYPAEQVRPSDLIVESRETGDSSGAAAETSRAPGPRIVNSTGAVDLNEFERLNVVDPDVGRMRPGEAGAATELQHYFGGKLGRSPEGVSGDFVVLSGPQSGKTVDLMLTPDTALQADRINQFFERNLSGFASTLELHLQKADFVPMDTRFLTEHNRQLLEGLVSSLPAEQQDKIIFIR